MGGNRPFRGLYGDVIMGIRVPRPPRTYIHGTTTVYEDTFLWFPRFVGRRPMWLKWVVKRVCIYPYGGDDSWMNYERVVEGYMTKEQAFIEGL